GRRQGRGRRPRCPRDAEPSSRTRPARDRARAPCPSRLHCRSGGRNRHRAGAIVSRTPRQMEAELSAKSREVAAVAAVIVVVVVMGVLLGAWVGFPKGVDAYQHLTRLKFVADHFPHHNWFYAWAAGMPMFDNYPGLPYVAALPCDPVRGPFVAGYVALVQLSERGFGGIRPLIALAGLSFLLAAQPILSSLSFGIGGTILGVDRPELGYSSPVQLIAPQFAGFAAFCIPTLVVLLQLPRRFWRSLGAGLGLLAIIAYMFAPNWRVPTRYYYINGIDPATVPNFPVIVGGLCFAAPAPSLSPRNRSVVLVGITVHVAVHV